MRRDLLALGLILSFLGLVFLAVSQVVVKPEPLQNWVTVPGAEVTMEQPSYNLSVQGTLTSGDRFRVYFTLATYSGPLSDLAMVLVNVTDPNGHTQSFDIPIMKGESGHVGITESFPTTTANYTGTYRASAEAYIVSIVYLAFQKMEIKEIERQYPNSVFFPVGVAVFAGGIGVFLLGTKISKRTRRFHKHKG